MYVNLPNSSAIIIPNGTPIPAPKLVSFTRSNPIQFIARYEPSPQLPPGTETEIGFMTLSIFPYCKQASLLFLRYLLRNPESLLI